MAETPYTEQNIFQWITSAEAAFGKVKDDYENARKYYENDQAPDDVPDDKEYVKYNLTTDLIRRRVGELVSAVITPVITGGGRAAEPQKLLFLDVFEENRLQPLIFPEAFSYLYCEGYGAFKFSENPFKKSKYGIGFPTIDFLPPTQAWLDPDALSGFHTDDNFRVHPKRILYDYAIKKWPEYKDAITQSLELAGDVTTDIQYVDLYEVEFKVPKITTINGKVIEEDIFYITKVINKTVTVEEPEPTGYPVFRIIPLIHTPRISTNYGKYPFGLYELLGDVQDQLNITESVMLDAVKAAIKQLIVINGATSYTEAQVKKEAAKTNGVIINNSPGTKIDVIRGNELSTALVEWANRTRFRFDEVSGSSNSQRGQEVAQLSGKAIRSLQVASNVPELTAKAHIENALTDLAICVLTWMKNNKQEFFIEREIQGQKRQIFFNKVADENTEEDEVNILHGGVINPLDIITQGTMVKKVEVELNQQAKEEFEMNKALLMHERQALSLKDLLKIIYPNSWEDKLESIKNESQAQALIQDIADTSPEFLDRIAQEWSQMKPIIEKQQAQIEKLEKLSVRNVS